MPTWANVCLLYTSGVLFCGEERLEDTLEICGTYATATVRDNDAHSRDGATPKVDGGVHSDANGVSGGTSIQAVGEQVRNYLPEFPRVSESLLVRLYIHMQANARVGCPVGVELENLTGDDIRTKQVR